MSVESLGKSLVLTLAVLIRDELPNGSGSGVLLPSVLPLFTDMRHFLAVAQDLDQPAIVAIYEPLLTAKLTDFAAAAKQLQKGEDGAQELVERLAMELADLVNGFLKALAPMASSFFFLSFP